MVELEIKGKKFLAIVDTGAELSIIRQSVQLWCDTALSEPKFSALAIGETTAMPVLGASVVPIDFRAGTKSIGYDVNFLVVADTIFDKGVAMLVGQDVLFASGIDNHTAELTVRAVKSRGGEVLDTVKLPVQLRRATAVGQGACATCV